MRAPVAMRVRTDLVFFQVFADERNRAADSRRGRRMMRMDFADRKNASVSPAPAPETSHSQDLYAQDNAHLATPPGHDLHAATGRGDPSALLAYVDDPAPVTKSKLYALEERDRAAAERALHADQARD